MSNLTDLHEEWSRDPEYREAYELFGPEFELSRTVIEARTNSRPTQAQLAERMKTTPSVVARLEGGRTHPSTKTLEKITLATGNLLGIRFGPPG
ncbi:MAG: helix-turn-helix transcriptional regulator [Thiotrichales bacterium]|nr:helix-turn-helix transcriptional regulator [Thiotrichales bacterium]